MATFNISIPGNICCPDQGEYIEVGEYLALTLDATKFAGLVTNPVNALVNSITSATVYDPVSNAMVAGNIYNLTTSDSDMPIVGGLPIQDIDYCDVTSVACESCCDALDIRVTELEQPITISAGTSIDDVSGGIATVNPGERIHIISTTLDVTVQEGSAIITINIPCTPYDPGVSCIEPDFNPDLVLPPL